MTFPCHVVRVLIASPGDCNEERYGLSAAMNAWNLSWSEKTGIYLWPWMWETCSFAAYGRGGQDELNHQLVAKANACIAFFRHKLGSNTKNHESGTVEEIEGCIDRGLKPAVYFLDDGSTPTDPREAKRLDDYRRSLQTRSFYYKPFKSTTEAVTTAMASIGSLVEEILEGIAAPSVQAMSGSPAPGNAATGAMRMAQSDAAKESLNNLRGILDESLITPIEADIARDKENTRNIIKASSSVTALADFDWRCDLNESKDGWLLVNTSGTTQKVAGCAAYVPGGENNPNEWERYGCERADRSKGIHLVEPGEVIRLDGTGASLEQMLASYISMRYDVDGKLVVATLLNPWRPDHPGEEA